MTRELKEAKAAHANCSERFIELQHEIDTLRQDAAYHNQTIQHLRGRYEVLEEQLAKEADNSARARAESYRKEEEVTKLLVEDYKTSKALEQALKEVQVQRERVKMFQGYVEQYKQKVSCLLSLVSLDSRPAVQSREEEKKGNRECQPPCTTQEGRRFIDGG